MPDVTHAQVEEFFRSTGLKFSQVPGRDGVWELGFMMPNGVFTVHIDNGVGHPGFLSVTCLYMKALANRTRLFQELLKKTGSILFAKFGLTEDGDVLIRASVPRDMQSEPLEKLTLARGAVLQAADQWWVELQIIACGG